MVFSCFVYFVDGFDGGVYWFLLVLMVLMVGF